MSLLADLEHLTATVESGSFAAAARRLGVTPSAVSRRVARLERELGVMLLARTTRRLRLTNDGQGFYERCVRALEELHEARDALQRTRRRPSGVLRVDAANMLGREVLAPALPRFLARYREVRLELMLRDQHVDPVAEGLDVLVRIGALRDSPLIARKLGESRLIFCAAPAYVRKHGAPAHPRELARHVCVGYLRDGRPTPFTFVDGERSYDVAIDGVFHANDAAVLRAAAIAGEGIVAIFDFAARAALASGELVTVLDAHPSMTWPIHALYPRNRHLLPKVSVFLDFLVELFRPARAPASSGERRVTVTGRRTRRRQRQR